MASTFLGSTSFIGGQPGRPRGGSFSPEEQKIENQFQEAFQRISNQKVALVQKLGLGGAKTSTETQKLNQEFSILFPEFQAFRSGGKSRQVVAKPPPPPSPATSTPIPASPVEPLASPIGRTPPGAPGGRQTPISQAVSGLVNRQQSIQQGQGSFGALRQGLGGRKRTESNLFSSGKLF